VVKTKELVGQMAGYQLAFNTIHSTKNSSQRIYEPVYQPRFTEKELKQSFFIPDWDSMDQRGNKPGAVLSCDDVSFEILRRRRGEPAEGSITSVKGCTVM